MVFRTEDEKETENWILDLLNLTSLPIHTDDGVEQEAQEAMLQSLPILRGETDKIDLELKKYEDVVKQTETEFSDASQPQSDTLGDLCAGQLRTPTAHKEQENDDDNTAEETLAS